MPVDLVIDHSVQVDQFGSPEAMAENMALEFQRNRERYEFLRGASRRFATSASFRRGWESAIRSIWSSWQSASCCGKRTARWRCPIPWWGPTATRR